MPNIFLYCLQKDKYTRHYNNIKININIKYNFYKIANYIENQYNNFI